MGSLMTENKAAWNELKRVAWVRTGALGDLVVGLASLYEMQEFFPRAEVTVVKRRIQRPVAPIGQRHDHMLRQKRRAGDLPRDTAASGPVDDEEPFASCRQYSIAHE